MKPNIVLIGFMCSGKTTYGRRLAEMLSMEFIDTDKLVETISNMSVKDIFDTYGEQRFRELETNAIKIAAEKNGAVIACGGGIVISEENMHILKQNGTVVYLYASADKIYRNARNLDSRPLLNTDDVKGTIRTLLDERRQLYLNYYDVAVDVTDMDIREGVRTIASYMKSRMPRAR